MTSIHRTYVVSAVAVLALGCSPSVDRVTAPASPQAADIDRLWSLSLSLGVAVWLAVMALMLVPMIRSLRRRPTREGSRDPSAGPNSRPPGAVLDEPVATGELDLHRAAQADRQVRSRLLWIGGIIGPTLILAVLLIASGRVGASTAHVATSDDVVIDVTAHMFWWEVEYPDHEVRTANEIHVPVDRPVRLRLFSEDVIHSFWVPRVHGKIDTIPGQENWLIFTPTETGRFRGVRYTSLVLCRKDHRHEELQASGVHQHRDRHLHHDRHLDVDHPGGQADVALRGHGVEGLPGVRHGDATSGSTNRWTRNGRSVPSQTSR